MDHKTLGETFQEILDEFSEMQPTSLDELEDKVLKAIHRLGSYLMGARIEDWNTQLHQEKTDTCEKCGGKLKHKQEERQIATWVSDMNYKRYRSYCPECKKAKYPLDQVLGIRPRQRLSNKVTELSVLCDYVEHPGIMESLNIY